MFKKIIKFIKYNTLTTIIIAVAFVAIASAVASNDDVKKNILGEEIIETQGVDNTLLLAADLEEFDLEMKITNVTEDDENYYIDYEFITLGIQDNVWQEIFNQGQLVVSIESLGGEDLGLYIMEELGEVIDYQLAYLKEVQENEEEKGETLIVKTTKYTKLIGLVFNKKTKKLPGYELVVKPPVAEETPPDSFDEGGDIGIMEPTDESPPDTGTLQDSYYLEWLINNCLDSGRYWYGSTCNAEPENVVPVCDSDNLDLCDTQELCEGINLYWYDNNDDRNEVCNVEEPPHPNPLPPGEGDDEDPVDPVDPVDPTVCDSDNLDLCIDQKLCEDAGLYWYDNDDDGNYVCNVEEPPHPNPLPPGEGDDEDPVDPVDPVDPTVCDSDNLDLCDTQKLCDGINLYWYGGECHLEDEEEE